MDSNAVEKKILKEYLKKGAFLFSENVKETKFKEFFPAIDKNKNKDKIKNKKKDKAIQDLYEYICECEEKKYQKCVQDIDEFYDKNNENDKQSVDIQQQSMNIILKNPEASKILFRNLDLAEIYLKNEYASLAAEYDSLLSEVESRLQRTN